jgi:hypothetical protein
VKQTFLTKFASILQDKSTANNVQSLFKDYSYKLNNQEKLPIIFTLTWGQAYVDYNPGR